MTPSLTETVDRVRSILERRGLVDGDSDTGIDTATEIVNIVLGVGVEREFTPASRAYGLWDEPVAIELEDAPF